MVYNIKIKKFIIYSIYNADMQTLYKETLILSHSCISAFVRTRYFCMSAFILRCRHADIKVYNITIIMATMW